MAVRNLPRAPSSFLATTMTLVTSLFQVFAQPYILTQASRVRTTISQLLPFCVALLFLAPLIYAFATSLPFIGQQGTQRNLMMAASMLAMVPTALLVILLQKHLVRGLLVTGLGGR